MASIRAGKKQEARTQGLAKGEANFEWNWLCVSPQSAVEELAFWFLLYLCQEQMIEETDDVLAFVTRYLRPFFKHAKEGEGQTRHPNTVGLVAGDPLAGTIYEVFDLLKKHYALQERWKGGRAYIRRVVGDVMKTSRPKLVVGIDPEVAQRRQASKQRGRGHSRGPGGNQPEGLGAQDAATRRYTVKEVVRQLRQEVPDGVWVPSRDRLYDWGDARLFTCHLNERERKCLDEDGLNMVRARVEAKRAHQKLVRRAEAVEMSRSAIKKRLIRGCGWRWMTPLKGNGRMPAFSSTLPEGDGGDHQCPSIVR